MHDDDLHDDVDDELNAYRATWWARLIGYIGTAVIGGATALVLCLALAAVGLAPPGWDRVLAGLWDRLGL